MNRLHAGFLCALFLVCPFSTAVLSAADDPANVTVIELKTNWRVAAGKEFPRSVEPGFDDSAWTVSGLPLTHQMNAVFGRMGEGNTLVAWHRRIFHADPSIAAGAVFLQVTIKSSYEYDDIEKQLYVNGRTVNGGLGNKYNITSQLIPGADNVIALRVQWRGMFKQGSRSLEFEQALLSIQWPQNYSPPAGETEVLKNPIEMAREGISLSALDAQPAIYTAAVGNPGTVNWQFLAFSPDGNVLGGAARTNGVNTPEKRATNLLFRWNPRTGRKIEEQHQIDAVSSLFVGDEGGTILLAPAANARPLAVGESRLVRCASLWSSGKAIQAIALDPASNAAMLALIAGPDGKSAFSAMPDAAYEWDLTAPERDASSGILTVPSPKKLVSGANWVTPVVFSEDGSTLFATTKKGGVEVWDLKKGMLRGTVTDASQSTPRVELISVSKDGSRAAVLFAGSRVFIVDGASATTLQQIGETSAHPRAIALASDASLLATSSGSAVILWDPKEGRQLGKFDPGSSWTNALALSREASTVAVGSESGVLRLWDISEFTDRVAPAERPSKSKTVAGAALSPEQEHAYLLLRYRRLADEAVEKIMRGLKFGEFDDLTKQIGAQGNYVAQRPFAAGLKPIGTELNELIRILNTEQANRLEIASQVERRQERSKVLRHEIEQEASLGGLLGFAAAFIGAAGSEQYIQTGSHEYTIVHDERSDELFNEGVGQMLHSALSGSQKIAQLNQMNLQADEDARKQVLKARAAEETAIEHYYSSLDAQLAKLAGGKSAPGQNNLHGNLWSKAAAEDANAVSERQSYYQKLLGSPEPFTGALAVLTKLKKGGASASASAGDTASLQGAAKEIANLAQAIPSPEFYDRDRAALYMLAGEVALKASQAEIAGKGWKGSSTASAALAAELYSKALSYSESDDTGEIRAGLAWSLAQSGKGAQGLSLAEQIAPLQKGSSEFQINFARVACANGKTDEGFDALERALSRLGYSDLNSLKACPDFPADHPRFLKLTAVDFDATTMMAENRLVARLVMHALAPRKNLQVQLIYPLRQPVGAYFTKTVLVPALQPDEPYQVPFDLDALPFQKKDQTVPAISLNVTSPQGPVFVGRDLSHKAAVAASEAATAAQPPGTAPVVFARLNLASQVTEMRGRYMGLLRRNPGLARDWATLESLAQKADATTDAISREQAVGALKRQIEGMRSAASRTMVGQDISRTLGRFMEQLP